MTRTSNRGHVRLYGVYGVYEVYGYVQYVQSVYYVAKGFLRSLVVYLKDHVPYLDSSLFIVILRI